MQRNANGQRVTVAAKSSELATLIARHIREDGRVDYPMPGVELFRNSRPTEKEPRIYDPAIVILAQGRKQCYLSDESITYDAENYLVLSVPIPVVTHIVEASPERPLLGMSIQVDVTALGKLLLELGGSERPSTDSLRCAISTTPLSKPLHDAALRLLRSLENPDDAQVLGPLCVREILYRVLDGPQGGFLRALVTRDGNYYRIAEALNRIHTHCAEPLEVPELADVARMSVSAFYRNFKAVTSLSPLQYLKKIRLHKARSLMLFEGLNAGESAYRVGYNSPSQFSREFRRLFGVPPTEEVARAQHAAT